MFKHNEKLVVIYVVRLSKMIQLLQWNGISRFYQILFTISVQQCRPMPFTRRYDEHPMLGKHDNTTTPKQEPTSKVEYKQKPANLT